jgi:hypothetical protein
MALTYIPPVVASGTLSRRTYLTYFQAVMADQSNMDIDTYQLRMWLNLGIMKAAALVRKVQPEVYRSTWFGIMESTLTRPSMVTPDQNWYYLDLKTPFVQGSFDPTYGQQNYPTPTGFVGMVPFQNMYRIESININRDNPNSYSPTTDLWQGAIHELPKDKFSAILTGLNDQWRQDIVWSMENNELMIYKGPEVTGVGNWADNPKVDISILRKPILDDLQDPYLGNSNLDSPADIPEEAMPLLMEYARQYAMQALGKPLDPTAPQATQLLEQSYLMTVGNYAPDSSQ